MALSLLSQAANGTTFEEIRKVLNLNHDKAIVATQFHDYFNKPNDAAQTINQFVKNKTNEKITEIVKPEDFDGQTGAILINAITLKSKWSCPFSIEDTISSKFFFNMVPEKLELAVTDVTFFQMV